MKLNKHYVFSTTDTINGPYVVVYDSDRIGMWQMDVDKGIELRIEMTMVQGEKVARDLARLIAAQKEKVILNRLEDTDEDKVDDDMLERAAHH